MYSFKKNRQKDNIGGISTEYSKRKSSEISSLGCDMQHIARSNLCELSQTICEQVIQRNKVSIKEFTYQQCSPWINKNQQHLINQITKIKPKLNKIEEKPTKYSKNSENTNTKSICDKENIVIEPALQNYQEEEYQIQKYPSIFMRIKAVKQIKKQQKPQTQILTVMIKRRSHQNNDISDIKKIILSQKIENHSQNLKMFNKKILDAQTMKKKKSLSAIKYIPNKNIELPSGPSVQKEKDVLNQNPLKLTAQHWKGRKISFKSKRQKTTCKNQETKSMDRKKSRENMSHSSKKASLSLQKRVREQFQSLNTHSRHLYDKYINTININHPNKQQKFHRL